MEMEWEEGMKSNLEKKIKKLMMRYLRFIKQEQKRSYWDGFKFKEIYEFHTDLMVIWLLDNYFIISNKEYRTLIKTINGGLKK